VKAGVVVRLRLFYFLSAGSPHCRLTLNLQISTIHANGRALYYGDNFDILRLWDIEIPPQRVISMENQMEFLKHPFPFVGVVGE
jgi:hypothetical protein